MASRAHSIHDYSFGGARALHRRQAWFRTEDPVNLPRNSLWIAGFGAIATAFATAAIVAGSAYTVFHVAPATLSETPALALTNDWQPDFAIVAEAGVLNLLQGPALAVPSKAAAFAEVAAGAETGAPTTTSSDSREVFIDDSKLYPLDQAKRYPREHIPNVAPRVPVEPGAPSLPVPEQVPGVYPNPTTTPPDAIAPSTTDPTTPKPLLDPENPYRDGI